MLTRQCLKCNEKALRISYKFPRKEEETISVIQVVGLTDFEEYYLPMLWEGMPHSDLKERWFDFKYLGGKGKPGANRGLNRPAVFSRTELTKLFELYRTKTGNPLLG